MMANKQFEARLMRYVQGDLPAGEKRQMAQYLLVHPQEQGRVKDLIALEEISAAVAADPVPQALLGAVEQRLGETLPGLTVPAAAESGRADPTAVKTSGRRPAKAIAAGLASIAAVLTLYLLAEEYGHSKAFAAALTHLQQVDSFRVGGTMLTPGGRTEPVRMWFKQPRLFRIEIGAPGSRRIVTHNRSRLILLEGSRQYSLRTRDFPGWSDLAEVVADIAPPGAMPGLPGVAKEDRGDTTRYTVLKPSVDPKKRHRVEVDRNLNRVVRHSKEEKVGEKWVLVSDLSYTYSGRPPADSLFAVSPPADYRALDEAAAEGLWFERSLTTGAALTPISLLAVTLAEDWRIDWVEPSAEGDEIYNVCAGGACEFFALNQSVVDVFRFVGSRWDVVVDDPVLQKQKISLKMEYRQGLSLQRRLSGLEAWLGVEAAVSPWRDSLTVEMLFEQDGRAFPISSDQSDQARRRFSPIHQDTLENGQVRYWAEQVSLEHFILALWSRSTDWRPGRASLMVKRPETPGAYDPFAALIDVDMTTSGRWADNYRALQQRFGVAYTEEKRAIRIKYIQVFPALVPADAKREAALPVELAANFPNPANPTTTIPFILANPATVTLRLFDSQGQLVRTLWAGNLASGPHQLTWDGRGEEDQPVASGAYLYRLEVNGVATPAQKLSLVQ